MTQGACGGNHLRLLSSGATFFPSLLGEIEQAVKSVFIETYIFANDTIGQAIATALLQAARRGVLTHLLVDGFGSKAMPERLRQELIGGGVQFLVYNPQISPFALRRRSLRRMHRKLAVIDQRVAFIGGINLIDDIPLPHLTQPRYDYAVRVEGPLVSAISAEVEQLWRRVAWANLRWRWRPPVAQSSPKSLGLQDAALVVRDNLRHRFTIEEAYLSAMAEAKEEILLANAYFFPGRRFRRALKEAAKRRVRVVLLLQGRMEYRLFHYATQALYGPLLEAGVEIYEYHKSFMHAKVAVVDGKWATVGSSNIDPFSLLLAREANIIVEDLAFARELRDSLYQAMAEGARAIEKTEWSRQPLWRRLLIWSAYGLTRLAFGLAVYGWTG